jgi:hypothetical protein
LVKDQGQIALEFCLGENDEMTIEFFEEEEKHVLQIEYPYGKGEILPIEEFKKDIDTQGGYLLEGYDSFLGNIAYDVADFQEDCTMAFDHETAWRSHYIAHLQEHASELESELLEQFNILLLCYVKPENIIRRARTHPTRTHGFEGEIHAITYLKDAL